MSELQGHKLKWDHYIDKIKIQVKSDQNCRNEILLIRDHLRSHGIKCKKYNYCLDPET